MIDIHKTLDLAAKEMERLKNAELTIVFPLSRIISVVSVLQLALRHPDVPKESKEMTRKFIDGVIELIGRLSPDLGDFMRLGDDPQYDTKK